MPWCEPCARYLAPSAVAEDGSCPECGGPIQMPTVSGRVTAENLDLKRLASADGQPEKAPWHFKLLVALLILYLGWRVVQLFA